MAGKRERKDTRTPKEKQIEGQLQTLKATVEKQKDGPNEQQKKQLADLRSQLGQEKFVRIANKRVPKALAAIEGIGNLAGVNYRSTDAQVQAIVKAFTAAVAHMAQKLSGKKEEVAGFQLPQT
jgi:sensor domain CHASE-containing protein